MWMGFMWAALVPARLKCKLPDGGFRDQEPKKKHPPGEEVRRVSLGGQRSGGGESWPYPSGSGRR
jgi:hypothetical protein